MKKLMPYILISILLVGILFLLLDKCGSTRKYDELQGTYETHRALSKRVVQKAITTIKEQEKEIEELDKNIKWLHGIIEVREEELAEVEKDIGKLKRDFTSLKECQTQYNKLVEGFQLCKSINADKDKIIFDLTAQYQAQLSISNSCKSMYESAEQLIKIRDRQVKELEKINKRLRLISGLKTSLAIILAGVVLYSMVTK